MSHAASADVLVQRVCWRSRCLLCLLALSPVREAGGRLLLALRGLPPRGATSVCRAPCCCFCPSTAALLSNALPPCRLPQEDLNVDDAFAAIARNALRNEAEEEPFVPETVELGAAAAPRRAQSSCC